MLSAYSILFIVPCVALLYCNNSNELIKFAKIPSINLNAKRDYLNH